MQCFRDLTILTFVFLETLKITNIENRKSKFEVSAVMKQSKLQVLNKQKLYSFTRGST